MKYVFCPGFSDGYDTDIQLEVLNNDVEYFAILDALSLEY